MPADTQAIEALILATLRARYKVQMGRAGPRSECDRPYSMFSTTCVVAPGAERVVQSAWVTRAVDELVDMVGPDTRHGLLVIRDGGAVVEDLTAGAEHAPVWRLRLMLYAHGSSYEEWQAMQRKLREDTL